MYLMRKRKKNRSKEDETKGVNEKGKRKTSEDS